MLTYLNAKVGNLVVAFADLPIMKCWKTCTSSFLNPPIPQV